MIADAIDKIARMTRAAQRIEEAPDFNATGRYFIFDEDGDYQESFAARPPTSTWHYSTVSLAARVRADLNEHAVQSADVYWSNNYLRAELSQQVPDEDAVIRWRHTLHLQHHPAFNAVAQHGHTQTYGQKELIRFLRAELNGHVDEAIVEQFRSLKLTTQGGADAVVAKGRESIDRRIQQQIRQEAGADVPDEIIVTIPVHDLDESRGELYPVTILVDVGVDDSGNVQFELTTVLNTLREAERAALDRIVESLVEHLPAGSHVFHGNPE